MGAQVEEDKGEERGASSALRKGTREQTYLGVPDVGTKKGKRRTSKKCN